MTASLRALFADPARRRMLVVGFLAFALIGAVQALYGPAFPAFRSRFGIGEGAVGAIVSFHFFGSFTTIALSGVLLARFGYRRALAGGALVLGAGALGVALAPTWALALVGALAIGLGFGLLDVAVNLLFVRGFERGRAPALNLLNAMFGVGAVLGPLLVGLLLPRFGIPFAVVGVATLLLVAPLARLDEPAVPEGGALPPLGSLGSVAGFALFYFLYVATEVGVASWETEYLAPTLGLEAAAALPALYWGALTVGRVVATPLSARLRPRDLVLGAAGLALVGAALAIWRPAAPVAYTLVGFALAPIFPTGLAWLEEAFPRRAERLAPVVVAAANLGPVPTAWLIGRAVETGGPTVIPWALTLLAGLLFVVALSLWTRARRA